jgi:predicted glycosyltransferase
MITALLYVQHLLGIGHLVRACALAQGLEAAGIRVVVVSGGMPVPVLDLGASRFEQLPPVRAADESFKVLLDENGTAVSDAWKAQRRERLLAIFDRELPDIVITELYPFGRRQMRFEIAPLLEHARTPRGRRKRPLLVSSVRDILVPPAKAGRTEEIIACIRKFYDLVLIHGDQNVIPFERSFAPAAEIADISRSTGYVVRPAPARQGPGSPGYDEVLVSAGGGAVSGKLLRAIMGARALCRSRARPWRVLIGHNYPEKDFLACQAISQGGYNTVTEILAAGVRAVCLPFAEGRESEQTLRCRLLAERGVLQMIEKDALCPEQVAMAVDRGLESPHIESHVVDTDGAARSAELLLQAVKR